MDYLGNDNDMPDIVNPFRLINTGSRNAVARTSFYLVKAFSVRSAFIMIGLCLLADLYIFVAPITFDIFINGAGWSIEKYSGVVGGVVEQPTAGSVVHVSSVASATVESYSTTPVSIRFNNSEEGKQAESKGMKTYSPARRGDSAVNTTLPTVESGDEDASSGDEDGSTLGSIISALSVEHITPSRSMIRKS